jgi:hypothetical protein
MPSFASRWRPSAGVPEAARLAIPPLWPACPKLGRKRGVILCMAQRGAAPRRHGIVKHNDLSLERLADRAIHHAEVLQINACNDLQQRALNSLGFVPSADAAGGAAGPSRQPTVAKLARWVEEQLEAVVKPNTKGPPF